MRISIVILLAIVLIFVILPELNFLSAQPLMPDDPDQTPIDGGLGILAAAGGAYALKKLKNYKKG